MIASQFLPPVPRSPHQADDGSPRITLDPLLKEQVTLPGLLLALTRPEESQSTRRINLGPLRDERREKGSLAELVIEFLQRGVQPGQVRWLRAKLFEHAFPLGHQGAVGELGGLLALI